MKRRFMDVSLDASPAAALHVAGLIHEVGLLYDCTMVTFDA